MPVACVLCPAVACGGVVALDRSEGTEEEWKHRDFLGPRQWARLTEALEKDFADCDTVLLGVPTPLVLISQA